MFKYSTQILLTGFLCIPLHTLYSSDATQRFLARMRPLDSPEKQLALLEEQKMGLIQKLNTIESQPNTVNQPEYAYSQNHYNLRKYWYSQSTKTIK